MIHLAEDDLALVKKILRFHLAQGEEVFAYGSRATGERLKPTSDLDLCVRGKEPLSDKLLTNLRDHFDVSGLPTRVDVLDWHAALPSFRAIIEKHFVAVPYAENQESRATEL